MPNQRLLTLSLLLDVGNVLLGQREVHGDSGRLDGDTTVDFVLTVGKKSVATLFPNVAFCLPSVGETHLTSLGRGNNTGLGDKGVGKSRLAVVDVGNDRHVTDVGGLVHEL